MNKQRNDDGLVFVPLGGSGEIGMNLNLYGCNGKWIIVDVGVSFHRQFGIEVVMPDPEFIESIKDDLLGIIITHGHEDHVGAVQYLWDRLEVPVYTTPFTAAVLNHKLKDAKIAGKVPVHVIDLKDSVDLDPFKIEFVTLTHSIPEPNGLMIHTPLGKIFHTGDWKIDPHPLVGEKTDENTLIKHGDEGVLAMVCDSTNVFYEGESGSEIWVRDGLIDLVKQQKNRVAISCFASNIARIETCLKAAQETGRHVCLLGRSMHRMVGIAKETGYFKDIPPIISEEKIMDFPPSQVLIVCTGSQAEPRAALRRIAAKTHPNVSLSKDDTVIFSSRMIPGNEKEIGYMQNDLVEQGIEVITHNETHIHVSGHPAKDELKQMYEWVRPQISIPVHGETRHLVEHARLAKEWGIKHAVIPYNGAFILLAPGNPEIIQRVNHGVLGLDGTKLISMDSKMLHDRFKASQAGHIFVTLLFDKHDELKMPPQLTLFGVEEEGEATEDLEERLKKALDKMVYENSFIHSEYEFKKEVENFIKRFIKKERGTKPVVSLHVLRQ